MASRDLTTWATLSPAARRRHTGEFAFKTFGVAALTGIPTAFFLAEFWGPTGSFIGMTLGWAAGLAYAYQTTPGYGRNP